jgi:hypothetical protein
MGGGRLRGSGERGPPHFVVVVDAHGYLDHGQVCGHDPDEQEPEGDRKS